MARKDVGNERWAKRVVKAITAYDRFLFFDTIYVGGGNAKHLDPADLAAQGAHRGEHRRDRRRRPALGPRRLIPE